MFHPRRQWRFDFAFEDVFLAIEIQGYGRGHASYVGMKSDYEKHNAAIELGWSLLYLMKHDLVKTEVNKTIKFITSIYESHKSNNHLLVAKQQLNSITKRTISHTPSKQHDQFQEWIRRQREGK